MNADITLKVNGKSQTLSLDPQEPLLYALREEFGLNGPKFGCGLQQCGACMVLVDGEATPTCMQPCSEFQDRDIQTIENLHTKDKLHPVQQSFVTHQAAQCGYCLNGMLISSVALLRKNPSPSDSEIREALNQVICRCGTHSRFIRAVKSAADSTQKF